MGRKKDLKPRVRGGKKIKYIIKPNGCYDVISHKPTRKNVGYFHIVRFKKDWVLTRLLFYVYNGYFPETVMHTCDNPMCINPEHLKAGTPKDNSEDMVKKGRSARGTKNKGKGHKLTEDQVREIRRLLKEGKISTRKMAKMFGLKTHKSIYNIRYGKKWGWLKDNEEEKRTEI